jgi:serine/threonine-protein kinase/endoribonuclease IRE1
MQLRPPGDQQRAAPQRKLFLAALAFALLPWLQIADAQQQPKQQHPREVDDRNRRHVGLNPDAGWAAPAADALKPATSPFRHLSDDESSLETVALALEAVRAPVSRHPGSGNPAGLASPHHARSLRDWEVEDFVLLATVDGDLYATDRRTGQQRWHLEVEQPMVETHHYRANTSVLDDDYSPIDHYIWAVEPNKDGGLYLWNPEAPGPISTGFTMKRLVESMVPHASDDPYVVYTGKKETTMITLDSATGRILKWFSSGGSHVNEAESCLNSNTLYDRRPDECISSSGTITLGRTEYTVGIHRREDSLPVALLKYSEWSPNRFDSDLYQQYHVTLDDRYITSQHDGKVYAFDYRRTGKAAAVFSHKFSSPVVRVFDVCRPIDAPSENLVVLPQPLMPSQDDDMAKTRLFLNRTESGSWYAMSGGAYPLISHAPLAQISKADWSRVEPPWDTISEAKLSMALVGTHILGSGHRQTAGQPKLPSLPAPKPEVDVDIDLAGDGGDFTVEPRPESSSIATASKQVLRGVADHVHNFISNPILILVMLLALFLKEKKLRRTYHVLKLTGSLKEAVQFFTSDESAFDPLASNKGVEPAEEEVTKDEANVNEAKEKVAADEVDVKEAKAKVVADEANANDDTVDVAKAKVAAEETNANKAIGANEAKEVKASEVNETTKVNEANEGMSPEKKKKNHRGRRGGVKHRKPKPGDAPQSQSRGDDSQKTVEDAVRNAQKLGDRPSLEPDVMTVASDVQAVSGPTIRVGNIEVNMDEQLGSGSNGTLVFAGKFDGRAVAVKRMLVQFYDLASQETKLLRESDDHPNGALCCVALYTRRAANNGQ